jgi:hypothetical protein
MNKREMVVRIERLVDSSSGPPGECLADIMTREARVAELSKHYQQDYIQEALKIRRRVCGKLAIHCSDGRVWATAQEAARELKVANSLVTKMLKQGAAPWKGLTFWRAAVDDSTDSEF